MPGPLPDAGPILAVARRYPLPFAAGAVGLVLAVRVLGGRRPSSTAAPDASPEPVKRAAASPVAMARAIDVRTPRVLTTPEGCPLPKPPASAGVGPGDFVCDPSSRTWVWQPDAPQLSADGCPLPKPSIPATHAGLGDWVCDKASKRWVWQWRDIPTVPAIAGTLTLQPGTYQTWVVGEMSPRSVTLTAPETWRTGPRSTRSVPAARVGGVTLPAHSGLFVSIVNAPNRAALTGRLFETNQTGATWRAV